MASWRWSPQRNGRSRSKWSRRVIIGLGLSLDQSRQINHLAAARGFAEGQVSDELRLRLGRLGELARQDLRDPLMQLLPPTDQERLICRLLYQVLPSLAMREPRVRRDVGGPPKRSRVAGRSGGRARELEDLAAAEDLHGEGRAPRLPGEDVADPIVARRLSQRQARDRGADVAAHDHLLSVDRRDLV